MTRIGATSGHLDGLRVGPLSARRPPANPAGGIGANPVGRPAILPLALLIVGTVWLVRALAGPGSSTGTARQELDLRYGRGELARGEYL
jgi:hypothetical protein